MQGRPADPNGFRRLGNLHLVLAGAATLVLPIGLANVAPTWAASRITLWIVVWAGAFLATWPLWRRLVASHGPQHSLQAFVLAWFFFLIVPILVELLALPSEVYLALAGFMGAGLAALVAAHVGLRKRYGPATSPRSLLAAVLLVGALVFISLYSDSLVPAFLLVAAALTSCLRPLSRLRDPVIPERSPFGVYLPWRNEDGTPRLLPAMWWARFPAHLVYMLGTLVLFVLWIMIFDRNPDAVPRPLVWMFVFNVPNLLTDIPRTLVNFATGVWFNYHPVQLVYVFVLLMLFGIWFEVREGSLRAIAVFYGSSIFAGITAGLLLHLINAFADATWIEKAWVDTWNGGSAGAFGLAGAYAARARRPWLLLALVVFWELNVELWHLRSYTVVFHMAAISFGFVWVRYRMPPATGPRESRAPVLQAN